MAKKSQKMLHGPALPYVLIKKLLRVPCELNFGCVVTLFFFSPSLLVLHHYQWSQATERKYLWTKNQPRNTTAKYAQMF